MARQSDLAIDSRRTIPARELRVEAARSGGPGGQNVNKVSTKVVLRFSLEESEALTDGEKELLRRRLESHLTGQGEVVIHASRHRERLRNLEDARERLAGLLREGLRTPRRRVPTRPTRASRQRRLEGKRRRSAVKRERRGPPE